MFKTKEILSKISADYSESNLVKTTGAYWKLSTTLQEAESQLREYIQEITKNEISQIVEKLKSNRFLEKQELEYIKLWIVGDADYYVKFENNYNDWTEELKRLMIEINQCNSEDLSFEEASKLRAILLDGIRVLGDIVFFIKQKERLRNFSESIEEIDDEERDLLIRLLEGKIKSPNE